MRKVRWGSPRLRHGDCGSRSSTSTYDEGGRGLLLVAQLTRGWGTRYSDTGKTIWAAQALHATQPGM